MTGGDFYAKSHIKLGSEEADRGAGHGMCYDLPVVYGDYKRMTLASETTAEFVVELAIGSSENKAAAVVEEDDGDTLERLRGFAVARLRFLINAV